MKCVAAVKIAVGIARFLLPAHAHAELDEMLVARQRGDVLILVVGAMQIGQRGAGSADAERAGDVDLNRIRRGQVGQGVVPDRIRVGFFPNAPFSLLRKTRVIDHSM